MIRYKITGIARRKPVTIMVELPHDSTEDSDWKATAAAATVLHRYRETGSDFKWHRKAEIVPAFDTKYFRRAMKLKDSSVRVPSDDRRFVVFLEAEQLLHFNGWLVAMFAPWWIFFRIGDAIQGTCLENWIGLPHVLIVLGNSAFWFFYLLPRTPRNDIHV
jgi:hypothetical protein